MDKELVLINTACWAFFTLMFWLEGAGLGLAALVSLVFTLGINLSAWLSSR